MSKQEKSLLFSNDYDDEMMMIMMMMWCIDNDAVMYNTIPQDCWIEQRRLSDARQRKPRSQDAAVAKLSASCMIVVLCDTGYIQVNISALIF